MKAPATQPNPTVTGLWGSAVDNGETGFTPVPDILIRSQDRLELSPMEFVVLLNILLHWWRPADWPFPRLSAISRRIGTTPRTVQRTVRRLEDKGLVVHCPPERIRRGLTVRRFDLSGLVWRLQQLVQDHHERAELFKKEGRMTGEA